MLLRNINDIILNNGLITIIRDVNFSPEDIENQIITLPYSGKNQQKYPDVENAKLPAFAQVFYYLFFRYLKIPDEDYFFTTYADWLGGFHDNKIVFNDTAYDPIGIKNRLLRTYPSLIRDLHFNYLLNHSNKFESVTYSLRTDYFEGIDLTIKYNSNLYFISIYVETTRGVLYKEKKKSRHDYSKINEIELKVNFNKLKKIGQFYLLTDEHVNDLIETINTK